MNPIPGRISLLSSESSGFAQIGILAIPQGQILRLGCGTSSCSSKIRLVSWFGSSDSGIFGGSSCILGGVICLCEPPDCCSASWGLLGDVIIYHASLLAETRKNCHSLLFSDRYLPYMGTDGTEFLVVTPSTPSFRPRSATCVPIR